MSNKVKEVLVAAKEVIVRYGWTQRTYGDEECGYCIYGAVTEAADRTGHPGYGAYAMTAMNNAVRLWSLGGGAIAWNDKPERTKDEVLELFDAVISKAV